MHPYKPAPVREIKGRIAPERAPAPVLVELERPRDARSGVGQVDSRQLHGHLPLQPANVNTPWMKAACHTAFGKGAWLRAPPRAS